MLFLFPVLRTVSRIQTNKVEKEKKVYTLQAEHKKEKQEPSAHSLSVPLSFLQ